MFSVSKATITGGKLGDYPKQKNLQNPVWWIIIENARTFLSKTPVAFRKIPNRSGGAGKEGG
jgi:hypothetical protein